jgi:hypothetical protein
MKHYTRLFSNNRMPTSKRTRQQSLKSPNAWDVTTIRGIGWPSLRRRVGVDHLMKQRLDLWIATTQGIESNALMGEVDIATHQSVRPVVVAEVRSSEQIDSTMFMRPHRIPKLPVSHPFVERLIGTLRRELLDRTFFWNALDLERKLQAFGLHYNGSRVHQSLRR